jgi:hypothetical protein
MLHEVQQRMSEILSSLDSFVCLMSNTLLGQNKYESIKAASFAAIRQLQEV